MKATSALQLGTLRISWLFSGYFRVIFVFFRVFSCFFVFFRVFVGRHLDDFSMILKDWVLKKSFIFNLDYDVGTSLLVQQIQ